MNDHQIIPDPNAAHSVFSPSGSYSWLTCLGYLWANVNAPDDGNEDTAYGTVGHSVGERWLEDDARPSWLVGWVEEVIYVDSSFNIEIDDEMMDYVQRYVEWCQELPGEHFVEGRLWAPEGLYPIGHQGGTADHIACEPGILTVTDLKMGRGVQVSAAEDKDDPRAVLFLDGDDPIAGKWDGNTLADAEGREFKLNGNPQGLLYALYAFYKHDARYNFQKIVIRICQPRLDHFDVWETTREELLRFEEFVRYRAKLAYDPAAPRTPTAKGCRFCKVRNLCTARAAFIENMVDECFEDAHTTFDADKMRDVGYRIDEGYYMAGNKIPKAAELTTAQIAKLLPFEGAITGFFTDLWTEAHRRALKGETIPGQKLVEGRMDRDFRSEKTAKQALAEKGVPESMMYSRKFVSPAQAEKLLIESGMKRKDAVNYLKPLVNRAPGRPTLVPENDARPAYVHPADDVFETFDDDADGL